MKRGLGAGLLVCAHCKRSIASSFEVCPFCESPVGSKPGAAPAPAAAPAPPPTVPAAAAPVPDFAPPAPAPQEDASASALPLELDFANVPPPPQVQVPIESELPPAPPGGVPLELNTVGATDWGPPSPSPDFQIDPLRTNPDLTAPQGAPPPSQDPFSLPVSGPPPSAGSMPTDPMSAATMPAGPMSGGPMSAGPMSAGPMSAGPMSAGPMSAGSMPAGSSLQAPRAAPAQRSSQSWKRFHPLVAIGAVTTVLALLPMAGSGVFTGASQVVDADSVAGLSSTTGIRVRDGFASRSEQVEIDPASPVRLASPSELLSRTELVGRNVEVTGTPLSLAIIKRQNVGPDGKRQDANSLTNVYAPITLDQRVWVVSEPVKASSPNDSTARAFGSRGTYRGVVQRLATSVDINRLRDARAESASNLPSLATAGTIPDDALAIITFLSDSAQPRMVAAPISGSERRVWAVTNAPALPETELFGDYVACPDDKCRAIESVSKAPPAGVLLIKENVVGALSDTVRKAGILLFALGIVLTGAGFVLTRVRPR